MAMASEKVIWEKSLSQARERAAREAKAVLLDFSAAPG